MGIQDAGTKNTVIIVDDDHTDRMILAASVRRKAPQTIVKECSTGNAALFEIEQLVDPDAAANVLVICDMELVQETAVELLQSVRTASEAADTDDVPFVIFTNSKSKSNYNAAMRAGCNGYFMKPASFAATNVLVGNVLDMWVGPSGPHHSWRRSA